MNIECCKLIRLPKIGDARGNLTFLEGNIHIPFEIKRMYYVYDVPDGQHRGGHAYKNQQKFMIAISGSFDVLLMDGYRTKRYHLNNPDTGVLIFPMIWHSLENFSPGSVCVCLSSTFYDESDYYRDWQQFISAVKIKKSNGEHSVS